MVTGGGAAVDTTDVALMLDNNGHMHPGARGVTLRELVRRDVRKLINDLVSVDIRWMKIGDAMAKELADLLRKCPRVTSLDVQDNFISCIGCMEIAKACASHAHIATLNLSGNRIADLGAAVVSSMLMANSSLTHLDLCGNRLERQATEGIGGGLRGNTTLQALLLDENFFGDEGANELGWALTYNSTLRTLSLRGNVCCPAPPRPASGVPGSSALFPTSACPLARASLHLPRCSRPASDRRPHIARNAGDHKRRCKHAVGRNRQESRVGEIGSVR
jgi:hypothetical protein